MDIWEILEIVLELKSGLPFILSIDTSITNSVHAHLVQKLVHREQTDYIYVSAIR